jgi:hypothetical protein
MATLRWTVLVVCSLWAVGGVIVMLGYGAGGSLTSLAVGALIDFGPLALSLLWITTARKT